MLVQTTALVWKDRPVKMGFFKYINQDGSANKGNTKGRMITLLFRTAAWVAAGKISRILFLPYLALYKFFVEWVLGIELSWKTKAGSGLKIFHGQATVIHQNVVIGNNCTIRQCTTIGNAGSTGACPVIGNNVEIGCNVCIIGAVTIGDNVVIGAGSVVVKNIPPGTLVVGNPARVIKTL